jgi:hypothetical protein
MRSTTWKSIRTLDSDGMLAAIGLQKRLDPIGDILVPSLTLFAAGAFVGAATAMLLTPKSGPMLRRGLADGAKGLTRRLGNGAKRTALQENTSSQSVER